MYLCFSLDGVLGNEEGTVGGYITCGGDEDNGDVDGGEDVGDTLGCGGYSMVCIDGI